MKKYIQKLISDYKEAKHEYRSPIKRCRDLGVKKEHIKKIDRFRYLFFLTKAHWILIFVLMILFINYLSKNFSISIVSYLVFGIFGLIFQLFAAIFFVRSLIKDKYEIALESTTRLNHNPDLIKSHIESTFYTGIGWFFLMLGFTLQSIALILSIIV